MIKLKPTIACITVILTFIAALIIGLNASLLANTSKDPCIIKQKYIVKDSTAMIPQIVGLQSKKISAQINNTLEKKIHEQLIIKDAGSPTYFDANFAVEYYNKNLLVIRFTGYVGEKLSAHPSKFDTSYTIDLKTGKFYSLKDLFKPNTNFKAEIIKLLKANEEKYRYKNTETALWNDFTLEDFIESWDYDEVEFIAKENYINLYYMGGYATGTAAGYKIPYKDMMYIINTTGSFWKALNAAPKSKIKIS